MVIYTAKLSKSKLAAVGLIVLAAIVLFVLLTASSCSGESASDTLCAKTNEDRIAFLERYGWEVEPAPVQTQEVLIPEEMNEVLDRYNQLQISQGFDLTNYAGEHVKRYVYLVTNHPDAQTEVYATLLVYEDLIIGGDIASAERDGFMHGFAMPE